MIKVVVQHVKVAVFNYSLLTIEKLKSEAVKTAIKYRINDRQTVLSVFRSIFFYFIVAFIFKSVINGDTNGN